MDTGRLLLPSRSRIPLIQRTSSDLFFVSSHFLHVNFCAILVTQSVLARIQIHPGSPRTLFQHDQRIFRREEESRYASICFHFGACVEPDSSGNCVILASASDDIFNVIDHASTPDFYSYSDYVQNLCALL